jgi:hypothetical protein
MPPSFKIFFPSLWGLPLGLSPGHFGISLIPHSYNMPKPSFSSFNWSLSQQSPGGGVSMHDNYQKIFYNLCVMFQCSECHGHTSSLFESRNTSVAVSRKLCRVYHLQN